MGNSGASKIVGIGDICLESSIGNKLVLKDIMHVPDIRLNLISTGRLDDEGFTNFFAESKWKLTKGSLIVAKGKKLNTLYVIEAKLHKKEINVVQKDASIELWHRRLGHINEKGLQTLARKQFLPNFQGMPLKDVQAKIDTIIRRLDDLETKKVQEDNMANEGTMQPCLICKSMEHDVHFCPTLPVVQDMFSKQANAIGTYR